MVNTPSKVLRFIHYVASRCLTNWVVTDPKHTDSQTRSRNYQNDLKTPHVYLCGGRLLFVKKKPYNVAILCVIIMAGVLYWVYEAPWTWRHQSPTIVIIFTYLWLLTLAFLIRSSASDPGIQPNNMHIPFEPQKLGVVPGPEEYFDFVSLPYYSDRYAGVAIKYCATCHIWRIPRTSHCTVCNVCIQSHDHHCVYLNNCVGAGNYQYFLWFLLTSVVTCTYLACFMFLRCFRYHDSSTLTFHEFIKASPVTLLLAILSVVGLIYPMLLLLFHLYLTAQNLTAREYLNNARENPDYVNVFDTNSVWKNLAVNWLSPPYQNRARSPRELAKDNLTTRRLPTLSSFSSIAREEPSPSQNLS